MTPVTRATVAGRAYLDLQNKARKDGRTTDELIQLYANQLVLKGGVLLAAFGNRRPTRDVDPYPAGRCHTAKNRPLDLPGAAGAGPRAPGISGGARAARKRDRHDRAR